MYSHAHTPSDMPTVVEQTVSKKELEKALCEESFYAFVRRFWSIVVPEKPVWNWHIEYLCDEMQKVAERVFKGLPKAYDLLINIPPGSTKSTICSIMFPAWVWTRMTTIRCICGSYSYPLSLELSRRTRDVIQSEKFNGLFSCPSLREDQNTKGYFINLNGGYRYSTSVGGTVTGFHGHFLIVDDPLDPGQAVSEIELKRANDWLGRTLSTRKVDKAITPTILIMQRLSEDDPSAQMLARSRERKGIEGTPVRHINLPAEIDETNIKEVRPRSLKRRYTNGLLDPVRMSRDVLHEARSKLDEYGYAGQFLQRPVPISGGLFKVARLHMDEPPLRHKFLSLVRSWDKAGTAGGGAYTVGALLGEDQEHRFWVLDVIRVQVDTGEREKLIKLTAQIDGSDVVVAVEQEPGSGGKESAENTVRNLRGYVVEVVRPTGDKRTRAIPLSSQVNGGNVWLAEGEWNKVFLSELELFPNSRYKDQVDASSGAFTVLSFPKGRIGVI